MSEPNITQQSGENQEPTTPQFAPITTQEEFDKRITSRLKRQTREFEARTAELTAKASKWDEWQEQNKTDLQRAQERVAELEAQVSGYEFKESRAAWTAAAAKEYGVPADLLRGDSEEEINAHAEALSAHFAPANKGPVVKSDGFAPRDTAGTSTAAQFAAAIDGIL